MKTASGGFGGSGGSLGVRVSSGTESLHGDGSGGGLERG